MDPKISERSKRAWITIRAKQKALEKLKNPSGYNSNETGAFVKFLLWLGIWTECETHCKSWAFDTKYPSDELKFFGYVQRD